MRLRAPGEYLIGKHSGGFRGDKKNGGHGEDPPFFYFYFFIFFLPFHTTAHSSTHHPFPKHLLPS